jgi:hypothetical protein
LYLAWLLCVQAGDVRDDETEPPVPAGLGELSASLEAFAEFLRIDRDLLDAAAAASPVLGAVEPQPPQLREWIATLPLAEKDDLLVRVMGGEGAALGNELLQRVRRAREGGAGVRDGGSRRRTVGELVRAGEQAAAERERIAAEEAAKEKERRKRATARARAKHLDALSGTEPVLWNKVENLIASRKPKSYDEAVQVLVDLRDLATRRGGSEYHRGLEALRSAHAGKPALIERLRKAGL